MPKHPITENNEVIDVHLGIKNLWLLSSEFASYGNKVCFMQIISLRGDLDVAYYFDLWFKILPGLVHDKQSL